MIHWTLRSTFYHPNPCNIDHRPSLQQLKQQLSILLIQAAQRSLIANYFRNVAVLPSKSKAKNFRQFNTLTETKNHDFLFENADFSRV
jgi:hypothetical protein